MRRQRVSFCVAVWGATLGGAALASVPRDGTPWSSYGGHLLAVSLHADTRSYNSHLADTMTTAIGPHWHDAVLGGHSYALLTSVRAIDSGQDALAPQPMPLLGVRAGDSPIGRSVSILSSEPVAAPRVAMATQLDTRPAVVRPRVDERPPVVEEPPTPELAVPARLVRTMSDEAYRRVRLRELTESLAR